MLSKTFFKRFLASLINFYAKCRDVQHQPDLGKNIPWPRAPKGFEATHEIMKKWFQRWRAYKVRYWLSLI